MTKEQIENFHQKELEIEVQLSAVEIKKKNLYSELASLQLSCDHKFEDGKNAGSDFGTHVMMGGYCGFHCEICRRMIPYGYVKYYKFEGNNL